MQEATEGNYIDPVLRIKKATGHILARLHQGNQAEIYQELLSQELQSLQDHYGFSIELGPTKEDANYDLQTTPLNPITAYEGVVTIAQELQKYPSNYIQKCAIKKLILVASLQQNGNHWGGVTLPDGILYVTVYPNNTDDNTSIIHHELEHQATNAYSQDKTTTVFEIRGKTLRRTTYHDLAWEQIHKKSGIRYSQEKWQQRDSLDGFARRYGAKNHLEDQATIMELLITNPLDLQARCFTDPILGKKVTRLILELKRLTNGTMDKQYFEDLIGKITQDKEFNEY